MMYKVIAAFADLQDGNHVYAIGDGYPRSGYEPDEDRVRALATGNNRLHRPLILEAAEAPAEKTEDKPQKRPRKKAE